MNLELLEVLVAFAESANLVQAAQRLKISQPAVTQRLQRLQEQSPIALFSFSGRKKVLTPYGKGLYDLSKGTLQHLEKGLENLNRRFAAGAHLVLRLGCRPELFEIFAHSAPFPGRIEFNELNDREALTQLADDAIDVALIEGLNSAPNFMSRKIFEGSSRFIFPRKMFPAMHTFRDLQKHKGLLLTAPCVTHKTESAHLDRLFQSLELNLSSSKCKATVEDWGSLVALVESGIGYSVVPAFAQVQARDLQSFEIPHAVLPKSNYYAIFRRDLKKIEAFQKALSFAIHSS